MIEAPEAGAMQRRFAVHLAVAPPSRQRNGADSWAMGMQVLTLLPHRSAFVATSSGGLLQ